MKLPWRIRGQTRSWLEERDRRIAAADEDEALRLLRSVRRIEIRSRRLVRDLFSGEYHSVFKGQGIEFAEVREYVPGDDVRLIDRNVSARLRQPFVKVYQEERELTVVFLVDQSGSMGFGSRTRTRAEIAAELTAVLAFSAVSNQDKVGCLLFASGMDKWVPPRKGRSHSLRVVRDVLSGGGEGHGTDLAGAIEKIGRVLKRRSIVFILSDFLDHGYLPPLSVVSRKHEVVPLVFVDPAELPDPAPPKTDGVEPILQDRRPSERALPAVGLIELEDLETGKRMLVDTGSQAVRAALRRAREELVGEETLAGRFRALGIQPIFLPMDGDYLEPVYRYFRLRARRRAQGR